MEFLLALLVVEYSYQNLDYNLTPTIILFIVGYVSNKVGCQEGPLPSKVHNVSGFIITLYEDKRELSSKSRIVSSWMIIYIKFLFFDMYVKGQTSQDMDGVPKMNQTVLTIAKFSNYIQIPLEIALIVHRRIRLAYQFALNVAKDKPKCLVTYLNEKENQMRSLN